MNATGAEVRSLEGKIAIVTGGGQGVGRGVALALASAGATVAVTGRTLAKCEAVAAEIAARGGTAVAEACDVERRDEVEALVPRLVERCGGIDILVNNAQSMTYASLRRLTEDEMETMWQSGPMGAFRLMQVCFPHLRDRRGVVVNVASGAGILPLATMAGYAMAKEAMRTLTRVAALEWGRFGIRVVAVCPLAESPGFDSFGGSLGDEVEASVVAAVPLGRLGDPETDIGRAIVFLCSEAGGYVTGSTLMLDGGYNHLR